MASSEQHATHLCAGPHAAYATWSDGLQTIYLPFLLNDTTIPQALTPASQNMLQTPQAGFDL